MKRGIMYGSGAFGLSLVLTLAGCSTSPGSITPPPTDTTETPDTAYVPGESYYGENKYVEYIPGDLPIILSAAHGGDREPMGIPDRTATQCGGSATTVKDLNTRELVLEMREAVVDRLGGNPHVVINHLHRKKLDANRPLTEAACGNASAEQAWHEFQGYLDRARSAVARSHGNGWYMDIHGHGHDIQRLELGYLLSRDELNATDETLSASTELREKSSINTLAAESDRSFAEVLRGEMSIGTLYAAEGFPAVPSASDPSPGSDPYFTGGYNTRRHGCGAAAAAVGGRAGGPICGVQIEANYSGVRDTEASRDSFAEATAGVLEIFLPSQWNIDLAPATP